MRIGMLVDRYKPYISGVTNCVSLNKLYLEKLGHRVFVFTFGDLDYVDEESNVIRSQGLPLIDTGFQVNFTYSREARRMLNTLDIAHIHHPFLSGSIALGYLRPRGIPLVFTNHTRYDLYTQAYLPMLPESIGETAMRAFLPRFCRSIDLVIAPSLGLKRVLEHFGVQANIQIIPNGVNLQPFRHPANPVKRSKFGIGENDIVLIYLGRLGPEKNLPFLLRSFIGTANAVLNVHLILAGDGPERDNLEDSARQSGVCERIHFTGLVPYADVPRYLSMADAFVTASITEVHPLTVIEAMARGLPVLGIDSPGVGDTIQDGVSGLLSSHDIAVFTAKMMIMVREADLRHRMGEAARLAANQYNIERTIQMTIDQYKALVATSQGRKNSLRARWLRTKDNWG